MFSFVGTRLMRMSKPSSSASVLGNSRAKILRCERRHSCKTHQTLWTTAVWSNDLALPFRMPCSAIVLSLWTTTRLPRSSSLKVDRPGQGTLIQAQRAHIMGHIAHHTQSQASREMLSDCHCACETVLGFQLAAHSPCSSSCHRRPRELHPLAAEWTWGTQEHKVIARHGMHRRRPTSHHKEDARALSGSVSTDEPVERGTMQHNATSTNNGVTHLAHTGLQRDTPPH